jgi:hypothetical protein
MTPDTYRIDTVAKNLLLRLEGTRKSYLDKPDELSDSGLAVVKEIVSAIANEHSILLGDSPQLDHIEKELTHTFFPRWHSLAVAKNDTEKSTVSPPSLLVRLAMLVIGVFVSLRIGLYLPGPMKAVPVIAALLTPFSVDIKVALHNRRYKRKLIEILKDLSDIQDSIDAGPPAVMVDDEEIS